MSRQAASSAASSSQVQHFFTKTLFRTARECPRKLVYASNPSRYPTTSDLDYKEQLFGQWLADEGVKLERYARAALFPNGYYNKLCNHPYHESQHQGVDTRTHAVTSNVVATIGDKVDDGATGVGVNQNQGKKRKTREELVAETEDFVLSTVGAADPEQTSKKSSGVSNCSPFFKGVVKSDLFLAYIDILHVDPRDNGRLQIMDVMTKSWDSRKTRDEQLLSKRSTSNNRIISSTFLPYIQDVAFQVMVAQLAFPHVKMTAWLILPDKANINTNIPYLNGMFAKDREDDNKDDNEGYLFEALKNESPLVAKIEITDLVEQVIYEDEFKFPGSSRRNLEYANATNDQKSSFLRTVHEWAETSQQAQSQSKMDNDVDNIQTTKDMQPWHARPPIGSQCKGCEYRLVSALDADTQNVTAMLSEKISNTRHASSGFYQCWSEAMEMQELVDPMKRTVSDLWFGGKTTNRLIDEGKFYLADVTASDLGLKVEKTKPAAIKKSKSKGWSRAKRQWHQVTLDGRLDNNSNGTNISDNANDDYPYILDRDYLQAEMSRWSYPLHFIDFETVAPALPYTVGRAPFDTLAFQFSHHVLHEKCGVVTHQSEFLHTTSGICPNTDFLNALALSLSSGSGGTGTVFRWAAHENTVLAALLKQATETQQQNGDDDALNPETAHVLRPLLVGGDRAMVDLMRVATKGYYVRGCSGSSSIKRLLLPTLRASHQLKEIYGQPNYNSDNFTGMQWWQEAKDGDRGVPVSPYELLKVMDEDGTRTSAGTDYDNPQSGDKDGGAILSVADGGQAMAAYDMLQSSVSDDEQIIMTAPSRNRLERSLKRYCEVDTLAMAMIIQAWHGFLDS
jgi:hypothetical protein